MVIDVLFNSCQIRSEELLPVTFLEKGLPPSMKHTLNTQLTLFKLLEFELPQKCSKCSITKQ